MELLLLAVCLWAGIKLWNYYQEAHKNRQLYTALAVERDQLQENFIPEKAEKWTPALQYGPFEEKNSDFVGWLKIEGTVIDYPVLQSDTPNYYLYRDFNKNYSGFGSIFLDEECDPDRSMNLLLHGHHMKNGSMFAILTQYTSSDFYEEHKVIYFDTLESFGSYEIVAALKVDLANEQHFPYYDFIDGTEEEFNAYIQNCKSRAFYDTGVEATYGDRLITLSTCEYTQDEGRMVVVARRIEN